MLVGGYVIHSMPYATEDSTHDYTSVRHLKNRCPEHLCTVDDKANKLYIIDYS